MAAQYQRNQSWEDEREGQLGMVVVGSGNGKVPSLARLHAQCCRASRQVKMGRVEGGCVAKACRWAQVCREKVCVSAYTMPVCRSFMFLLPIKVPHMGSQCHVPCRPCTHAWLVGKGKCCSTTSHTHTCSTCLPPSVVCCSMLHAVLQAKVPSLSCSVCSGNDPNQQGHA